MEKVWISDYQHATINVLGMLDKINAELIKRSAAGEDISYSHFMAYLAEEVTREVPPGTHFLRHALDEADKAREQRLWTLVSQRKATV